MPNATQTRAMELTVLMPCLNEAETIATVVTKAVGALREQGIDGEVLVSDNGSTDGSQSLAEQAGARVITAPERGYGAALIAGIASANGKYVIMADADDSYDVTALAPYLAELRAGRDLVMGNRFRGGISPGAMPFLHRYLGNPVLSLLGRKLFGLRKIRDFHCGMRGFDRDRMRALNLCMPGMEFASEMVVRASMAGYDMAEVPTTLQPDGRSRAPHLRTWRDGWRHLRFLLMFAPNRTLVLPGLVLAIIGFISVVALSFGPVHVGRVTFDINSLVYACMALLAGVQLVMCGGFSQLFGRSAGIVRDDGRAGWVSMLRFETCVAAGAVLVVAGLVGSAFALGVWGAADFGPLGAVGPIRLVLPSATAVALGVELLFSGLVGSLLMLWRPAGSRPPSTPDAAPQVPKPRESVLG